MLKGILAPIVSAGAFAASCAAQTPTVTVTKDDTVITTSCRVVIPRGTVIPDANGNGVIQVGADNIVIEFGEGSVLRGAPEGTPWDQLTGVGIRLSGHKGVALWKAAVHGYKVGIYVSDAERPEIKTADLSDNFRQRLKSTPWAEDASDWLYPHHNDNHEWMDRYGAALYIERTKAPNVSDVTVRRGQNGIVLDRVTEALIFQNDCSFLSGWGMAMWRSSKNRITRNKFDFCVRGYSHGVYNRGQDSAGILCFEQCSDNAILETSCTHGGDGFFGFAGVEAIGESPAPGADFDYRRRGCNDNLLMDCDFSYAAAHGIEMTFSHGNRFVRNKIVEDAICGIWAGYSNDTLILMNNFQGNGQGAYGLERGGVNIEHGSGNRILQNTFRDNACAVHLWWDDDTGLLSKPGVKANDRGVAGNVIANNRFEGDAIALQLRDVAGGGHVKETIFVGNIFDKVAKEVEATDGTAPTREGTVNPEPLPAAGPLMGQKSTKVGDARRLGRDKIVMGEWGPWDMVGMMIRLEAVGAGSRTYQAYGAPNDLKHELTGPGLSCERTATPGRGARTPYIITAPGPGVFPYTIRFTTDRTDQSFSGVIVNTEWKAAFFAWDERTDPRKEIGAWRALATSDGARAATLPTLNLRFGGGGPSTLKVSDELTKAGFKNDHFGVIARTALTLPKGRWRVTTTSDDGIRVLVNAKPVIENWTWHGPTTDTGEFSMDSEGQAEIVVEYFEIDGHSVLEFNIEPVP